MPDSVTVMLVIVVLWVGVKTKAPPIYLSAFSAVLPRPAELNGPVIFVTCVPIWLTVSTFAIVVVPEIATVPEVVIVVFDITISVWAFAISISIVCPGDALEVISKTT